MPLVSMQPLMYIYFINATETWKFDKKYEKLLKYIAFSVIPIWMLSLLGSGGCLKNLNVLSSACGDFTGMLIGWTGHIGWSFKANILFTFGWFLYVLTIVGTIGYKSLTTFFLLLFMFATHYLSGPYVGPALWCMTAPFGIIDIRLFTKKEK